MRLKNKVGGKLLGVNLLSLLVALASHQVDDRAVQATYVAGELKYSRNSGLVEKPLRAKRRRFATWIESGAASMTRGGTAAD